MTGCGDHRQYDTHCLGCWTAFLADERHSFADGLREFLEERAALEQSLGDDYSDSPGETALEQAHFHWGRADAFRVALEHLQRSEDAAAGAYDMAPEMGGLSGEEQR